ncbi:MAG: hypothetical protein MUD03_10440 [Pirellula sp.]|nr:hypothetical protein [Pirellula sp.]
MINRFTTKHVQVWQLVGLHVWHRTLIQQQVEWIRRTATRDAAFYPRVEWLHRDSVIKNFGSSESLDKTSDWDVLIVSIDLIEPLAIAQPVSIDASYEPIPRTDAHDGFVGNRLRSVQAGVLWDWTSQPRSSLALATELGLSGVISNPESLRHWLQVFMTRGAVRVQPAHPLLQKITIPSFSPSSFSPLER